VQRWSNSANRAELFSAFAVSAVVLLWVRMHHGWAHAMHADCWLAREAS